MRCSRGAARPGTVRRVCIASACSLSAETTAGHSTTDVGRTIGTTRRGLWPRTRHAFHDARPRYLAEQFADVAFSGSDGLFGIVRHEMVADPGSGSRGGTAKT